jgi:two-component system, OmpR family, sensor histidine kinase KdpD
MTDVTPTRGRLKIFLGYAAGVGKTFQMLTEARQLQRNGVDVAIAYFEPHGRADTIALTEGLDTIPRKTIEYRGARFEEMDADAVLARRPAVAVVDELPHTNVPGAPRAKRWEDVHELLAARIDVLTTMNVQHIESLNDQIWQSTGVRVRETVPDWVVQQADEVVMVDLTPRALLNRLARGAVYPKERAELAVERFFQESTLVALRELAMRQAASVVESRLASDEAPGAGDDSSSESAAAERLLLLVGPEASTAALIRRGRRVADLLRADCLAVYVSETPDLHHLSAADRDRLERHLNFARGLQIETRVIEGRDVAQTLAAFARAHGATQIFIDRAMRSARRWRLRGSLLEDIVTASRGLQVTVVADRTSRWHP